MQDLVWSMVGVEGLGFGVGLVLRVWGSRFGDWGLRFKVSSLGFRIWGSGFRLQGSRFVIWCLGLRF